MKACIPNDCGLQAFLRIIRPSWPKLGFFVELVMYLADHSRSNGLIRGFVH